MQQIFTLEGGGDAIIKLTTAHYYLPSGRCIHREENSTEWGVDPDVTVEMTPEQMRAANEAREETELGYSLYTPPADSTTFQVKGTDGKGLDLKVSPSTQPQGKALDLDKLAVPMAPATQPTAEQKKELGFDPTTQPSNPSVAVCPGYTAFCDGAEHPAGTQNASGSRSAIGGGIAGAAVGAYRSTSVARSETLTWSGKLNSNDETNAEAPDVHPGLWSDERFANASVFRHSSFECFVIESRLRISSFEFRSRKSFVIRICSNLPQLGCHIYGSRRERSDPS